MVRQCGQGTPRWGGVWGALAVFIFCFALRRWCLMDGRVHVACDGCDWTMSMKRLPTAIERVEPVGFRHGYCR